MKKIQNIIETTTKPTYGGINVTVGPNDTWTSNVPQMRQFAGQKPAGKKLRNSSHFKGPRKCKVPNRGAHFGSKASLLKQVPRPDLPTGAEFLSS